MPFRSPGVGAKSEQLGEIAVCQSNQIISNPRAVTGSFSGVEGDCLFVLDYTLVLISSCWMESGTLDVFHSCVVD